MQKNTGHAIVNQNNSTDSNYDDSQHRTVILKSKTATVNINSSIKTLKNENV